ncbi:uncharacterized protein LOC119090088 [Pollicipes pollicipes]|uniref:uncharacterized protein LOC119090088 n=1 Tax=Pollicipes pollicipes TaxID=41117 RepID=UPI00188595D9|nr:uncharacterized protein LOC119090088 [Pollicipes pollicipes]
MQLQIAFDRPFEGIIYSKGYFSSPLCHHASGGPAGRTRSFIISADACGTRFNRLKDGRDYMENVIVVQNDVGLQKAFDTARKIRCMLRPKGARQVNEKTVTYAFNVDTLDQKEVTFETDEDPVSKANAVLDIQIGQGPYAPSVDGLVKIGDILTMVVEAEGDRDVDVRVRQCIAMNGDRTSHVNLTDDVGCTMKPNLLSPWLKTKQNNAVMAYSYFSAFKFPEQMDVIIECNLDLCKGECGFCQEDVVTVSRVLERSRRELNASAAAVQRAEAREPVRLARRLRVVAPQDIAITEATRTLLPGGASAGAGGDAVCLSVLTFVVGLVVILLLLFVASIATAVLCVRARGQTTALVTALPDASFHAFSSYLGFTTAIPEVGVSLACTRLLR